MTGLNLGLWTVDVLNPASVQQQAQFGQNLDALAWNKDGSLLYASSKKDLYSYDPQTKKLTQLCKNALPGQADALEFGAQGLLGAVKSGNQTKIYVFDPAQCKVMNGSLFTLPYGNVRSIAANATSGEAAGTKVRTISYTYDALNRILRASYSDGLDFQYTYDAAGNALTYQHTSGGQAITTSYTYDAANQLLTAKDNNSATVWRYSYDHNGALKEMTPGTTVANGAKRYTYNAAGYLTQVEAYSGQSYQTQAQMTYDGRGQRLKMTAYAAGIGLSTQYTLDGSRPLVATSDGKDTTFYYGLGPIAEATDTRAWLLTDASYTPRQLTDAQGQVTLSGSFTPWGSLMEARGTGNFTFGYFGGLMDAATGLMYVGNGQYYDPATGRFLTRGALPGNSNPYLPWNFNPTGALLGPLALLGMFYRRKKGKPSAVEPYLFLLVLALMVWSVGVACWPFDNPTPTPTPAPSEPPAPSPTPTPTPTPTPPPTEPPAPPPVGPPTDTPPCPGCTPPPTPGFDKITFQGWSSEQISIAKEAILKVGEKLSPYLGSVESITAFLQVYGDPSSTTVKFTFTKNEDAGNGCVGGVHLVKCHPSYNINDPRLIAHELGHSLQHSRNTGDASGPYASLETAAITDNGGNWVTGTHPGGAFERTALGYVSEGIPDMYHGRLQYSNWNANDGQHTARNEDFADMYMNWVYNSFDYRPEANGAGTNRYNWIEDHIAGWIQ